MEMREQFWTLAVNVTNQVSKTNDHRTVEPLLLEILNLVKANPQDRQFFVEAFITILHDPRKWSNLIVPFCMRELQFQELYQEALRLQNCGDITTQRVDPKKVHALSLQSLFVLAGNTECTTWLSIS